MSHICNIFFVYGKYNIGEYKYDANIINKICNTLKINYKENYYTFGFNIWHCWTESPEVQLWEHILKYFFDNHLNEEHIYGIEICSLVYNRK
jgi:hypothetical protein